MTALSNGIDFDDGRFSLSPTKTPPNPFPVFDKGSWSEELDTKPQENEIGVQISDQTPEWLRTPLEEIETFREDEALRLPAFLEEDDTCSLNWTKGDKLGSGAFASVFKGLNNDTGGLFAVKQIEVDLSNPRKTKEALLELQVMKSLQHPNIVHYLGAQLDSSLGCMYVFLELVPGGSISSMLIKFGPFNEGVIRKYMKQILSGLEYLHSVGVIHRDVKGANMLVDVSGTVKLADFGCAKIFQGLHTYTSNCKSVLGTPYFMAPEVIRGQPYGKSADIWSMGCTLLEMADARPPWSLEYPEPTVAMFHIASSSDLPEIPGLLSESAVDFILCCLKRNRKDRATASQLLKHNFVTGVGGK